MPGLNEKVILTIKLELKDILSDLKKVKREVQEMQGKGGKRETAERKHIQQQRKETRDFHKEKKQQHKEIETLRKSETQALQKQTKEIKIQGGLFERTVKRAQQGYAQWRRGGTGPGAYQRGLNRASNIGALKGAAGGVGAAARTGVGAVAALGSGILGFLMSGIQQSFGTYLQVGAARGALTGMGSSRGYAAGLEGTGRGGGALGYGPAETYRQAAQVGRSTGNISAIHRAQQFARAGGGMDVGEAAGIMGQFRQGGIEFGNADIKAAGKGTKVLERVIAAGMATGIEKARLPEYLQAVSQFAEQQGGRQAGAVDIDAITKSMNWIMGASGMTGRRGAALGQRMDQMITGPGGGEAGQALVMQSMGFGKPGGEATYYEAMKQQEKGMAAPENMKNLLKEVYTQYGQVGAGGKSAVNEEANLVLKEMSGINLDIWEKIGDMVNSGQSQEEIDKKIEELMKSQGPIDKQALDATKQGFTQTLKYLAGTEAFQAGIGAKAAPAIMELEKLQRKAMNYLITFVKDHMPEILALIQDMGNILKRILEAVGGGKSEDINFGGVVAMRRGGKGKDAGDLDLLGPQSVGGYKETAAQRRERLGGEIKEYEEMRKKVVKAVPGTDLGNVVGELGLGKSTIGKLLSSRSDASRESYEKQRNAVTSAIDKAIETRKKSIKDKEAQELKEAAEEQHPSFLDKPTGKKKGRGKKGPKTAMLEGEEGEEGDVPDPGNGTPPAKSVPAKVAYIAVPPYVSPGVSGKPQGGSRIRGRI